MRSLRPALLVVVPLVLGGVGCALQTPERRMAPEPAPGVQQALGYSDVIRFSQDYALAQGYEVADVAEAEQVRPNYWRVRFGLAPQGSGRLLDLDFDAAQRQVVGSTELDGSATGGSGSGGIISPVP